MSRRTLTSTLRQALPALTMLSALAGCAQTQAPAAPVASSAQASPAQASAEQASPAQTGPAQAGQVATASDQPADKSKAPASLDFYFAPGSSKLRDEDVALLDKASRLYRDGKPIVMIVAGSSDTVGTPDANLKLSQARADAVLQGLVARGIPAARFQVLAKGVSDLPVQTGDGVANQDNRRVDLTWR